jgi:hypothetical protein
LYLDNDIIITQNLIISMNRQKLIFSALMVIFVGFFVAFSIHLTKKAEAASLTHASVTLSNSRMSYRAVVATGAAGSSAGGNPDNNTSHLFPGDVVCFTDAGNNVCRDNMTYTVANIINSTQFNLTAPLTTALTATDYVIASQSATWTISFVTQNQVPHGGSLLVTIPMADNSTSGKGNDGIPDSGGTVATSGFDLRGLANTSVTATGCGATWNAPTITVGGGGTATADHTFSFVRDTAACGVGETITVTVGGNGIINPAPVTSGHTQGTADVYGIAIATKDSGNFTIDSASPKVAPVEAVLISGTVDESLSFVVAAVGAGSSHCGFNTTVASTTTSIPWGQFAATNTFYYAAQNLTVSTNATDGYAVTIQENDQMGKNGNVCTGTSPSAGDYTFTAGTCIRDTVCSAATPCTEAVMGDWTTAATFPGLGYTLATTGGTTAASFFYNQGGRTYNAKQLADKGQGGETPSTIMSSTGPVSGDAIDVCYKISIPGTQPSGYYYNIAKYTVTATF